MASVLVPRMPTGGLRTSVTKWLRGSSGGLVALAIVVGVGAGLGAVVFRWLILQATRLFTGTDDYSDAGRVANHWVPWLGIYFVVLAPVVGGLLYGPLVDRFAREARGHGVPEVMYAVAQRGGRIPAKVAGVKALASAITIGSGGSVGREGPIVQIGSALGSSLGRLVRMPESRLRTLVACGAAGGIAATFNTPVAGVFFALELILADFAASAFGAVVLAAVTASVIGRAAFGNYPFLELSSFTIVSPLEYGLFALLGVLAAGMGVLFTRVLYLFEDVADRIWKGRPEWARPAVGGLLLGLLLLALPQMYGVGYPVLEKGVAGYYALGFLVVLMFGKILATSLTISIGGSGGVFAPSLFIGAMLGSAYGDVANIIFPDQAGAQAAYALVGMGAVFAGAARAPITAVLIMFELTGEYTLILPLMLAIVISTGVSRVLMKETIYTAKLVRRGVDLSRPGGAPPGVPMPTVAAVMRPLPRAVPADLPLAAAAQRILASGGLILPVTSEDGVVLGVVTASALSGALAEDEDAEELTVSAILEEAPVVSSDTPLHVAAEVLASSGTTGTAVTGEDGTVVGWLTYASVLSALAARPGRMPQRT